MIQGRIKMSTFICLIIVFVIYLTSVIDHYIAFRDFEKRSNKSRD